MCGGDGVEVADVGVKILWQLYSALSPWSYRERQFVVGAQEKNASLARLISGDVIAQYNLGAMLESGRGVAQDHVEALKWLNVAEVNGSKQATDSRRLVESLMTPEQIAEAQRRASEWMKKNVR